MKDMQVHPIKLTELALAKLNPDERNYVIVEKDSDFFQSYDEEKKKLLAKRLVQLSFFAGIKEPPSLEELVMIVQFLCRQFPKCTMKKLDDSFMKVVAGEIGEIEHYQQFSPQYVAKVIRCYEQYSKAALKRYNMYKEKAEAEAKSAEAAKNYNPIDGCADILAIEADRHENKDLDLFNDMEIQLSKWAIESMKRIGLFEDYEKTQDPHKYIRIKLNKIFASYPNIKNKRDCIKYWIMTEKKIIT